MSFQQMLLIYPTPPYPARGVGSSRFDYSVYPVLPFIILSSQRAGRPSFHLLKVVWWCGGLFDYSVKPGPDLSRSWLGLVRLLTRLAKASLAKLVTRLAISRTRLVKARARSLTINLHGLTQIILKIEFNNTTRVYGEIGLDILSIFLTRLRSEQLRSKGVLIVRKNF